MLTEVHRQAADNPIIRMSMLIREGEMPALGTHGESQVIRREQMNPDLVLAHDQVIVGTNKTRRGYNKRIRELKGFKGLFMPNDRVICLKNDREKGLLNGGIWNVDKIVDQDPDVTKMDVSPLDAGMVQQPVEVFTHHAWLKGEERNLDWREARQYQPFDFAYAITCHKSQGSQWDSVLVLDESRSFGEHADRWLYTAITRAAEKVTVVV